MVSQGAGRFWPSSSLSWLGQPRTSGGCGSRPPPHQGWGLGSTLVPTGSNPSLPLGPTAPLLLDGSEKARLAFTVCDLGLVFCPSPGTSAPRRAPHLAARKCPAPLRADTAVA